MIEVLRTVREAPLRAHELLVKQGRAKLHITPKGLKQLEEDIMDTFWTIIVITWIAVSILVAPMLGQVIWWGGRGDEE